MAVMNSIHGYFTDRKFNVLGVASTSLPNAIQIYQDIEIEEIESGVGTFEASLSYKKNNKVQQHNTSFVKVGNFFLFQDEDGKCKWYTIMKTKKDRLKKSIWFYGEDAGLDLLNEIVTEYAADKAYPIAFYINKFAYDSGFEIGLNELGDSLQRKLSWEGTATATERILSVFTQFDHAELSFSFEVSGNRISKKLINIHKKRGAETNIKLSLDRDVENIITTESILSLRTGLRCIGGTPEGADSPITLRGYSYDDGTYFIKDDKLLNREANQLWTRYLTESGNDEGYIVGLFEYDTLSQSELCNRAITQLKAVSKAEQNFEVSISKLPDNVKIGDTVYIVDADDELYLQARVLKLEKSRSSNKATATLGDYLIKSSNVSAKLKVMADEIKRNRKQTEIVAANGTKVNTGEEEPVSKKIGDIWFRKNADGTVDTVKWDGSAWQPFAKDIESKELTEKTEQALQDVAEAKQAAEDAFNKGVEAIAVGKKAELAGEAAKVAAEQATTDAQAARDKADAIQIDVNSLVSDVATINGNVTTISSKANEAYSKAQAVEGKTVTLEKSVDGLTGRLTAVETTSTSTTKKLNELEVTVDGQKQTLATVQTAANSALSKANVLEITVDGVKTTISQVQTDMKQLSNRNLLSNTATLSDMTISSSNGKVDPDTLFNGNATAKGVHVSPYIDTFSQHTINTPRDGKFTLTFWAKADRDMVFNNFFFTNGTTTNAVNSDGKTSTSSDGRNDLSATTSWKKYWITYTSVNATATRRIIIGRTTSTGTLWINSPMLVEGAVPADWQPAPEDLATVSKVNEIETTVDGVKTTVSSVKTTADSALTKATQVETTANGLKTTISSVETTASNALTKATQVEATASGIRQTVTEVQTDLNNLDINDRNLFVNSTQNLKSITINGWNHYPNGTTYKIPVTEGEIYTVRAYITDVSTTGTGVGVKLFWYNSAGTIIRESPNPKEGWIPNGGSGYFTLTDNAPGDAVAVTVAIRNSNYLDSTLKYKELKLQKGNKATLWTPAPEDMATSSQFTQLSDQINLKVSKGDVINQINVSTEGVLIDGKKVHITGQTTIDDAVIGTTQIKDAAITDAKISNISANKIKTGTLDAGVVNVVNINADNIKSGKITAIELVGSSFTNAFSYTDSGVTYTGSTVIKDGNVVISRTGSNGSIWTTELDRSLGFRDTYRASSSAPARVTQLGQGKLYMAESGVGGYLPAMALSQVPWTSFPYAAGFTTAENNPCQYRKIMLVDGTWELQLRGQIKPTSGGFSTTASPTGGVLPAGYRPARNAIVAAADSTKKGARVVVLATGEVQLNTPNGGNYVSFGGIRIAL